MGNHRAERGPRRTASAGRASGRSLLTRNATPGGARRATAPASRVNAIAETPEALDAVETNAFTPGRRVATTPDTPAAPLPAPLAAPLAAEADTVSATQGRVASGRRRAAAKPARSAGFALPTLKGVPSLPVIGGVAALALSVGGAVLAPDFSQPTEAAPQALATTAVSRAAAEALAERDEVVSRDTRRQEASEADAAARIEEAEKAAAERETKLARIDVRANKQAAKIEANQWHLPVQGYRLTATFGLSSRLWSTVHTGLDFAGPSGTPLMAVANGTITETGSAGAYGMRTILTLEDGTEIWYCHQSSIDVTVGQKVRGGEVIGKLGSTGNSTGPHLHLEVRPLGGDAVDPHSTLVDHGVHP